MGIPLGDVTDIICIWYNATTKTHIASTSDIWIDGILIGSQATYLDQSDLVLGIDDLNLAANQISIYPIPANNYVTIKNTTGHILAIDIYDIRGAFIKTINVENGKKQINVSELHSGIYLISYVIESQRFTKKLVIE